MKARQRRNPETLFQSPRPQATKAKKHADPIPEKNQPAIPKPSLDLSSISRSDIPVFPNLLVSMCRGERTDEPAFPNLPASMPAATLKHRDDWEVVPGLQFLSSHHSNSLFASEAKDLMFSERLKAKKDNVSEQKKQQTRKGTGEYTDTCENISYLAKQFKHPFNTDNALDRFVGTTADKKYDTEDVTHNDIGEAFQNQEHKWKNLKIYGYRPYSSYQMDESKKTENGAWVSQAEQLILYTKN